MLNMASLKRMITRRRKCLILMAFMIAVVYLGISAFPLLILDGIKQGNESPVSVVKHIEPKEPKYNVLDPPAIEPKLVTIHATPHQNPVEGPVQIAPVISINATVQNKTKALEIAGNKTLQQLAVLGVKGEEKVLPKAVFEKMKWNLSVSFEDIGNIMKDTSFLNKLTPLNLTGPMLTSSRNRTNNFTYSMPIKMGYCDCWEHYCFCCVQLVSKQLHINVKACSNFTFISRSHNLDLTFKLDNTTVYEGTISADAPPLLCLGSIPTVADICVHFSNITYRIDTLALHKSQLLGCTDFSLNIYNKTINVFPVDCFQIPGNFNHHPPKENLIIPNFMP